ncbi:putative peptide zinc metalloprotease protein [uncultured Gammaproteobacteria bacterium]
MLPQLRNDLVLLPGPPTAEGAPTWTVHDPVRNRYFRLSRTAFTALAAWGDGRAKTMLARVEARTGTSMTETQLTGLISFLHANALIEARGEKAIAGYVAQEAAARLSWPMWLLHHYLFIRVPLLRPHRLLVATLPLMMPFYSRIWRMMVIALGTLGLFLAVRQWPQFVRTFTDFLSWEGATAFAVALVGVKVVHELAHAYTATRYGCRVATMGVAFMVLWPVLYTDTSDVWRLVSRRQRLEVAAAGIAAELTLAALATLLWSFLPDGPMRGAAFVVATVSWVGSVAVNLNPLMRFDGYYLLSDGLDLANLQERSFAFGRWWLRERLFDLGEPPPERFQPGLERFLVVFSATVWLYRLFLFTGIALLVYHFSFKLLGIGLMMVELGWFIARPIWAELRQWWSRRGRLRLNVATARTLVMVLFGLGLLLAPWRVSLNLPALSRAAAYAKLYLQVPGRIQTVHVVEGQTVTANAPVITLVSPDLDFAREQVTREQVRLETEIRLISSGTEGYDRLPVLYEKLAGWRVQAEGLAAQAEMLTVRTPINGVVIDLVPSLLSGTWLRPSLVARVVKRERAELVALVESADLHLVKPGAAAWFLPEDPDLPRQPAEVLAVETVNQPILDQPYLVSLYGGLVSVLSDTRKGLMPAATWYRVTLRFTVMPPAPAPARVTRGVVQVEAEASSLITRLWRTAATVLIRESGF